MRKVVIPAASPGIMNGIILGMGRIFGETAALLFTLGMGTDIATNLLTSSRSLALHLYSMVTEVSPAKGYGTAVLLVVIVLILNLIAGAFGRRINRYKENL
jgi:phosphate transport system permease protein